MDRASGCLPSKRQEIALWIAIGFLFVGVNLAINGFAILLPTFVGYALLAIGFWEAAQTQAGFWRWLGQASCLLSALMILLSFPTLFRFAFPYESWETYDRWTFFVSYIEGLIPLLTPLALWNVFPERAIRRLTLMVYPVAVLSVSMLYLLYDDHKSLALFISGGLVPLYAAAIFAWANWRGERSRLRPRP